jgi:dihydrofolate reductase/thymidylate synthase
MKFFSAIVSVHQPSLGIGISNKLPWRLKEDLAFFKEVTSRTAVNLLNAVIMGRKTWESIPDKFRPLPGRRNVVLSRNPGIRESLNIPSSVMIASSLTDALAQLSEEQNIDRIFVIGGSTLYQEAVRSPLCQHVYITEVNGEFKEFDTFFPVLPASDFQLIHRGPKKQQDNISYRFTEYQRHYDDMALPNPEGVQVNAEEMQYLNVVKDIIDNGVIRGDRTGTGTISKFGVQMRFSLRDNIFPLITTKKVFWRGVAEELLWFVKGSTNAKELQDKNIHIWDGNGSRKFLDSLGLHNREEGDLGPVYGFQVRVYIFFHGFYELLIILPNVILVETFWSEGNFKSMRFFLL